MYPKKQLLSPHTKQGECQIDFFEENLEIKFLENSILGYKKYLVEIQGYESEIID